MNESVNMSVSDLHADRADKFVIIRTSSIFRNNTSECAVRIMW